MKKIIMTLMFSIFCCTARAEWTWVHKLPDGTIVYVDATTIRKEGPFRQVWTLTNYGQRRKDGHISSRSLQLFDCSKRQYRFMNFSSYSDHWATGNNIEWVDPAPAQWLDIPPGSNFGDAALRLMC